MSTNNEHHNTAPDRLEDTPEALPADEIPSVLAAEQEIPLETKQSTPPFPGFWFSVLSCIVFQMVLIGALVFGLVATLLISGVASGDIGAYLKKVTAEDETGDRPDEGNQEEKPKLKVNPALVKAFGPAMLFAEVVSLILAWLAVRVLVGKDWPRQLALRKPSTSHLVLALISFPALLLLPGPIHEIAKKFIPSFMTDENGINQMIGNWPLWLSILAVGLCPGIGEELWCRGFLGRGLLARYGVVGGVLLTSMFFGLLHLDPAYAVVTACMGLWLHFVYLTTRSLWLSMLLHFMNNSAAVVLGYFRIGDVDDQAQGYVWFGSLFLIAGVATALYQSRAKLAKPESSSQPLWQPDFVGVAYPPATSDTRVLKPPISWFSWLCVGIGLAAFGSSILLAYIQTRGG
jgi:membrane protease YdiL (CAAX protease family)